MWGFVSACSFAAYTLLGEYGMRRYSPWTVLAYTLLFAALSLAILHGPKPYKGFCEDPVQTFWVIYIAVGGTLVPFGLYFMAIDAIRATKTVITATLEPISAAFMAFIFLEELLESLQLLGGILVISSVAILQLKRETDSLTPESIRSAQNMKSGGSKKN